MRLGRNNSIQEGDSMKISIDVEGSFKNLNNYLTKSNMRKAQSVVDEVANTMITKLRSNTPVDTGETANSWRVIKMTTKSGYEVSIVNGQGDVVRFLSYGHATRNGGWVRPNKFVHKITSEQFRILNKRIEEVIR